MEEIEGSAEVGQMARPPFVQLAVSGLYTDQSEEYVSGVVFLSPESAAAMMMALAKSLGVEAEVSASIEGVDLP